MEGPLLVQHSHKFGAKVGPGIPSSLSPSSFPRSFFHSSLPSGPAACRGGGAPGERPARVGSGPGAV